MKYLVAAVLYILFSAQACSTGYETYKKTDGVTFAYKWAEAKNEAGEKVPALLISVQNENIHAVNYKMSVDFYFEGMLRESGELENCVPAGKTRKGKLNGVYLVSEKFTSSQISSTDFKLELNDIEVSQVETCAED
jgi:hypothetical protein